MLPPSGGRRRSVPQVQRARPATAALACGLAVALARRPLLRCRPGAPCYIAVFGGTGWTGREVVYQALQQGHDVQVLARDKTLMLTPPGSTGTGQDPDDLEPLRDARLKVVEGDVRSAEDVAKVMTKGVTGVVVALGGQSDDDETELFRLENGSSREWQVEFEEKLKVLDVWNPYDSLRVYNSNGDVVDIFFDRLLSAQVPVEEFPLTVVRLSRRLLTEGTSNIVEAMRKVGARRVAVVSQFGAGDSEKVAPVYTRNFLMMRTIREAFEDRNNQEAIFTSTSGSGADLEWTIMRPGGLTVDPPTGVIKVIDGQAGAIARADLADFCLRAVLSEDWDYLGQTPSLSSVCGTEWKDPWTPSTDPI